MYHKYAAITVEKAYTLCIHVHTLKIDETKVRFPFLFYPMYHRYAAITVEKAYTLCIHVHTLRIVLFDLFVTFDITKLPVCCCNFDQTILF